MEDLLTELRKVNFIQEQWVVFRNQSSELKIKGCDNQPRKRSVSMDKSSISLLK